MAQQKTIDTGERLMDFLSSCFRTVQYNKFNLIGLQVEQLNNGSYKILFSIAANKEEEEIITNEQQQKDTEKIESITQ